MTRTAIVTGAARGIGAATAKRLAADGYAVAVLDLDEAQCAETVAAITDAGGRALAVGANVADAAAVTDAVARVEAELGAPTILVNNAGIIRDNLLFKMTEEDWDCRALGAPARRVPHVAGRAGAPGRRRAGAGSSTSRARRRSATAARRTTPRRRPGMQGLTKTLAIELGRYGVTANAVAPGFIVTDMTRADRRAHRRRHGRVHRRTTPPRCRSARRLPRRHRGRGLVLLLRGGRLRLRPGALRRGRSPRMTIVVDSPAILADAVGQTATGDWFEIDQERIAAFADATEDWQWIHLDAERAASGPFGATIAHGYLTLSLLPRLTAGLLAVAGIAMVVNYGLDRVRFLQPVAVGSRVRAVDRDRRGRAGAAGHARVCSRTTVELEGSERPALVAQTGRPVRARRA